MSEEYDRTNELFYKVLPLQESKIEWDELSKMIPYIPRGWFELSRLPVQDRVDFTRAFWFSKLPFETVSSHVEQKMEVFFDELEDVEVYATQIEQGNPFEIHMVYTLKESLGFFQGGPPASDDQIETLKKQFFHLDLPSDYLSFLSIHDGFSKYTDTGIIKTRNMSSNYSKFQEILKNEMLIRPDSQVINPVSLVPFYESFGLHCYQCFYADWYVENEMGNVYFSEHDRAISNFLDEARLEENLAFPTFLAWLLFYLEDIWHL